MQKQSTVCKQEITRASKAVFSQDTVTVFGAKQDQNELPGLRNIGITTFYTSILRNVRVSVSIHSILAVTSQPDY